MYEAALRTFLLSTVGGCCVALFTLWVSRRVQWGDRRHDADGATERLRRDCLTLWAAYERRHAQICEVWRCMNEGEAETARAMLAMLASEPLLPNPVKE